MDTLVLSGCFNTNTRLPDGGGLLRRPLPNRWDIHTRQFDERTVLSFLGGTPVLAPRVLGDHAEGGFIVEFVSGLLLEQAAPPHHPVAPSIVALLANALRALHQVPYGALGSPFGNVQPTDSRGFAHQIIDQVERFAAWSSSWQSLVRGELGIPADPCRPLRAIAEAMTPRMAALIHVDLHRRNAILRDDGELVLIDWEFSCIGDPVYDLARHIMMMDYTHAERESFLAAYAPHTAPACRELLSRQIDGYIHIEHVKEVLVLAAVLGEGTATEATHARLAQLLPLVRDVWAPVTLAA